MHLCTRVWGDIICHGEEGALLSSLVPSPLSPWVWQMWFISLYREHGVGSRTNCWLWKIWVIGSRPRLGLRPCEAKICGETERKSSASWSSGWNLGENPSIVVWARQAPGKFSLWQVNFIPGVFLPPCVPPRPSLKRSEVPFFLLPSQKKKPKILIHLMCCPFSSLLRFKGWRENMLFRQDCSQSHQVGEFWHLGLSSWMSSSQHQG